MSGTNDEPALRARYFSARRESPSPLRRLARSEPPRLSLGAKPVPRIGVDLGQSECRFALPRQDGSDAPQILTTPTWIGYSADAFPLRFCALGRQALLRRHRMDLKNPLSAHGDGSKTVWKDFAKQLRQLYHRRGDPPAWGVVSFWARMTEEERTARRAISNELFERVAVADPFFLIALGLEWQEASKASIIVDIGKSSIRAALMEGVTPKSEDCIEVPFGGDQLDSELRMHIALRYPELLLTDSTLSALKERLSFIPPARRRSTVRLSLRGAERDVDLTETMLESCEMMLHHLLRAVGEAVSRLSSDCAETFLERIILVGGGAGVRGLGARVEEELRREGLELAKVHVPVNPSLVAVKGAFRWAQGLEEDRWSVPLFSFGS